MTLLRTLAFGLALAATPALAQFSAWTKVLLSEGQFFSLKAGGGHDGVAMARAQSDTFRSVDGGWTWEPVIVGPDPVQSLHPSPTDSQAWYAVSNFTLYRSADGGATWAATSPRRFLPDSGGLYYLEVGATPGLLFAVRVSVPCIYAAGCAPWYGGTGMVSADGGATWTSLGIDDVVGWLHPSPADAQVVYTRRQDGGIVALFRSDDRGATWHRITPLIEEPVGALATAEMTLDRKDPGTVYFAPAVGESNRDRYGIYVTRDGGRNWSRRAVPKPGTFVPDPLEAGRVWLLGPAGSIHESRDAGRTWAVVEPDPRSVAASSGTGAAIFIHGGERVALGADYPDKLVRLALGDGALALGSDLWWDPAEPGTGLTITHRPSRQTFVVWYAYDAAGNPAWRVIPGGTWNDRTFSGVLYETSGSAWFGAEFDPAAVEVRRIGEATIDFKDESNGTVSWRLDAGGEGVKPITRQLFGPVATLNTEASYADLWWNAAEPGWGIAINHQHNTIFATWFVYDDGGNPRWVVMPDARVTRGFASQGSPRAIGDVYATRAGPPGAPFEVTKAGTATITFPAADRAVLEYVVAGTAGRKEITRQPF